MLNLLKIVNNYYQAFKTKSLAPIVQFLWVAGKIETKDDNMITLSTFFESRFVRLVSLKVAITLTLLFFFWEKDGK